jgi:hypothetical protein
MVPEPLSFGLQFFLLIFSVFHTVVTPPKFLSVSFIVVHPLSSSDLSLSSPLSQCFAHEHEAWKPIYTTLSKSTKIAHSRAPRRICPTSHELHAPPCIIQVSSTCSHTPLEGVHVHHTLFTHSLECACAMCTSYITCLAHVTRAIWIWSTRSVTHIRGFWVNSTHFQIYSKSVSFLFRPVHWFHPSSDQF